MEELIGWLILIGLVIAFIVYVVLPLTGLLLIIGGLLLLGIGITGAVSGAGVAFYNFVQLLIEGHKTVK